MNKQNLNFDKKNDFQTAERNLDLLISSLKLLKNTLMLCNKNTNKKGSKNINELFQQSFLQLNLIQSSQKDLFRKYKKNTSIHQLHNIENNKEIKICEEEIAINDEAKQKYLFLLNSLIRILNNEHIDLENHEYSFIDKNEEFGTEELKVIPIIMANADNLKALDHYVIDIETKNNRKNDVVNKKRKTSIWARIFNWLCN